MVQYLYGFNLIFILCVLVKINACASNSNVSNITIFKISHDKLNVLLSMCSTLFFTYSYMPYSIIETIIVPIVKRTCRNFSDSNNYRSTALATLMSKIFKSVIFT